MADAYIVEAFRIAGGQRGGALAGVHPADLAAIILDALGEGGGLARVTIIEAL